MEENETTQHNIIEHWRWNVNPTWHHFSSMCQEAYYVRHAPNEFMKYHHLRSCLYFAIGSFESFLNERMREKLEKEGMPEKKIYNKLRWENGGLRAKRTKWPSAICGKEITFPENFEDIFTYYNELRGEVTHPKRKDHSIYKELDNANVDTLIDTISKAFVTIYSGLGEPFPYWLLGWNYVGLNGDLSHPVLRNNQNGFLFSLQWMGYDVPAGDHYRAIAWEKRFMTTIEGYLKLKSWLELYQDDIEPYVERFPYRPRLTSKWWDAEYIKQ